MPRASAKASKPARPKPPEVLDGESLLAWERLVDRLTHLGKLEDADPELMVAWAEQVETYRDARRVMRADGFGARHANGVNGRSTAYTVQRETLAMIHKLSKALGLTAGGGKGGDLDDLEF